MSEEQKDLLDEIKISEEKDGTASVTLPEALMAGESDDDAPPQETEPKKEAVKEAAEDDSDEDHPDDTDAVREARRARRKAKKEYIKKTNQEKDQKLVFLQRQNQELMERLASLEQRTHSADLARLDKAMQDEQARLNYAKTKMREATDNSDGQAFIRAQEIYEDARSKVEAMTNFKAKAEQAAPKQELGVNPAIQEMAFDWMDKNPWYDPDGDDDDSVVAKQIDKKLSAEGWNPSHPSYWKELDKRLQKRLPHLYTDDIEETQPRRTPKSVVTGSEREVGAGTNRSTFTLTAEQVRAMKDAGFWDDPKMRAKMVTRYANYAKSTRS